MKLKSFTSYDFPDSKGHFGPYGGSFVSETLFAALEKLDQDYSVAINDRKFLDEFEKELKTFVGRPSPFSMHKDGPKRSAEANYILKGKISIIPELTKLIILSARFCLRNEPEKKEL